MMADLSRDFEPLRMSALLKAIKISASPEGSTIGPDARPISQQTSPNATENQRNAYNTELNLKNVISKPKRGATLSFEKICHEAELQRREEVRQLVAKRKQDMEAFETKLQKEMEIIRKTLATNRERERIAQRERFEAEEERLAQLDEMRRHHEAQLQLQRIQERKERLEKEAEEHRRQSENQENLEKILAIRGCFAEQCKEIAQLSKTVKSKNLVVQLVAPFTAKLRELNQEIDGLLEIGIAGNLSDNEVSLAENVIRQAGIIHEAYKAQVTKANELYDELVKNAEAEAAAAAAEQQNALKVPEIANPDTPPNETTSAPSSGSSTETLEAETPPLDDNCTQLFLSSQKFLEEHRTLYQDFIDSNQTVKFQKECTKTINFLLKKIAPTPSAMNEVLDEFRILFETHPDVKQSLQSVAFCYNLVAEIFIEQVEDSFVRHNSKWIYALAAVSISLWLDYPDLGDIMLAQLRTKCPYIIPVLLPRYQGQSTEDFYRNRGYKYNDGVIETEDEFIGRMSNLTKFYAAILITRATKKSNKPHPHGLGNAWRWFAALLNSEPQADAVKIYARVIKDMLEVAGNAMWSAYPRQFPKLLVALAQNYYPLLQRYEGDNNFAMSPLKDFLKDAIVKKSISPAEGQLPPNFW